MDTDIILYVAVFFTVIYLLQVVVSFIGLDSTDGLEADFEGDVESGSHSSIQLFTVRNALGFMLGFTWGFRIGVIDIELSTNLSILLGVVLGLIIVLTQSSLFMFMKKLEQKNIPSVESAINKEATVYLTIPAGRTGKVQVEVNGAQRTLYATSDENIMTGERVTVVGRQGDTLIVSKIKM